MASQLGCVWAGLKKPEGDRPGSTGTLVPGAF